MEYLDRVWDGGEGEVHAGYWLLSVTGGGSGRQRDHAAVPEIMLRPRPGFCEGERGASGGGGPAAGAQERARGRDDGPG